MAVSEFPYKNVEAYLRATGILETGNPKQIEEARKTFRRLYLQQYRKEYAKKHSSVNIAFTNADKQLLMRVASENGKKLASFIKEIALNVASGRHQELQLSIDLLEVKRLFSLCYDILEGLQFENEYPELKSSYDRLAELFDQIEILLNDY
jgi:predicted DNA binding CopG/RHH family protein